MCRRQFLTTAAASALRGRLARAESFPSDLRITQIVSFDLHTRQSKSVGQNACVVIMARSHAARRTGRI